MGNVHCGSSVHATEIDTIDFKEKKLQLEKKNTPKKKKSSILFLGKKKDKYESNPKTPLKNTATPKDNNNNNHNRQQNKSTATIPIVDLGTHTIKCLDQGVISITRIDPTKNNNNNASSSSSPMGRPKRENVLSNMNATVGRGSSASLAMAERKINYDDLIFKKELGSGTYGCVSAGLWKSKNVAIKALIEDSDPVKRQEVEEDFHRELVVLRKINHACCAAYLGFVDEPNRPKCMVFDLYTGGNLSNLLKNVRKKNVLITYAVCLSIARDCIEALVYLHAQKIIHRDIKAENILLESNLRARVTDFGLSRQVDVQRAAKMTVCGTPSWVAPEIFRGEAYDNRVDIYSYAIFLWELFASKKPYPNYSSTEIQLLVGSKGIRPERLNHLPHEINRLMARCWDGDANLRPNAPSVMRELEKIYFLLKEEGVLSHPVHYKMDVPFAYKGVGNNQLIIT